MHNIITLSETQMRIPDRGAISIEGESTSGNTAVCPPVQKVHAGGQGMNFIELPQFTAHIRVLCGVVLFL